MAGRASLSDESLHELSQCGLYQIGPLNVQSVLEATVRFTFRDAVRDRFFSKIQEPKILRASFVKNWKKLWPDKPDGPGYWRGPAASIPFARRVYEFLLKYEVVQPFEPYRLELEYGNVYGEHAIGVWKRSREQPLHFSIEPWVTKPRDPRVPYYPAVARWLAGRQLVEEVDFAIVNLPLSRGERWIDREINEPLAQHWINGILKQTAEQRLFPRSGSQCKTCSHPCTEIFHGSNDHSRN
jgi:hypothetical protein